MRMVLSLSSLDQELLNTIIHSCAQALSLMRRFTGGNDLVKPSRFKLAMPFLTLENMVLHKENLESMFSSNEWKTLTWASSREGKIVLELVEDAYLILLFL